MFFFSFLKKKKDTGLEIHVFAVRETGVSRHNGGPIEGPLKPLRVDSKFFNLNYTYGRENGASGGLVGIGQVLCISFLPLVNKFTSFFHKKTVEKLFL